MSYGKGISLRPKGTFLLAAHSGQTRLRWEQAGAQEPNLHKQETINPHFFPLLKEMTAEGHWERVRKDSEMGKGKMYRPELQSSAPESNFPWVWRRLVVGTRSASGKDVLGMSIHEALYSGKGSMVCTANPEV